MKKLLLPLTLLASIGMGQILDLATDASGNTLLMRTAFRLQTESDVRAEQKIYRWQGGNWTRLGVEPPQSGLIPGGISNPFVAVGGALYGWYVTPGRGLMPPVRILPSAVVTGFTIPEGFPREQIHLSANGRYLIGATQGAIPSLGAAEFLDRQSGTRTTLPADARFVQVSSTGVMAYMQPGVITYGTQRIPFEGSAGGLAISDDGLLLATAGDGAVRLYGAQSSTPALTVTTSVPWSLANGVLAYLSPDRTRVHLWNAVTRMTATLTDSTEPFGNLVLSADGGVLWAMTDFGRLRRFNLRTGVDDEILAPLGHTERSPRAVGPGVPGSAMLLPGKFTRNQTAYVGGQAWPLSDVNAQGYWYQIPWEWRGPETTLLMRAVGNPFEGVVTIGFGATYQPYFPFQSGASETIIAAHSDFRGVVTRSDPARAGETIHVYMLGLGALEREVPTGVRGPLVDPVRVARPVLCNGGAQGLPQVPVDVPAAIYAGGMLGIYQVDVTLPANVPDGQWGLECGDGARFTSQTVETRP
jgi:uncharacterized protein (TIGR03437 family)